MTAQKLKFVCGVTQDTILSIVSSWNSTPCKILTHLKERDRFLKHCMPKVEYPDHESTFLASTKNESWWPTNPLDNTSVNSKRYSFTLKIVTGEMRFPISFVQAIIVVSSFCTHISCAARGFTSVLGASFLCEFIIQLILGHISIL